LETAESPSFDNDTLIVFFERGDQFGIKACRSGQCIEKDLELLSIQGHPLLFFLIKSFFLFFSLFFHITSGQSWQYLAVLDDPACSDKAFMAFLSISIPTRAALAIFIPLALRIVQGHNYYHGIQPDAKQLA
jgi:hypothetical protein